MTPPGIASCPRLGIGKGKDQGLAGPLIGARSKTSQTSRAYHPSGFAVVSGASRYETTRPGLDSVGT
jgi:hypothetical protein